MAARPSVLSEPAAGSSARPLVLRARGLAVARDGRTLLGGVDLELRRGEVCALLGPNGVGKSSLLSVLGGLLAPAAGSIEVDGRIAAALQAPALARRSVRANVEVALGWWGVPRADRSARADAALERMRASHLAGRRATQLSGGEARRVHLARALALEADVLLLDEPFAGLDAPSRAELLADTGQVLRDPDRATLVVLHDRAEAWALADRLLVVLAGGVAAAGTPAEVLERPPTREVAGFLGFTGEVREADGTVRRLRPAQVRLDPGGPLHGTVARRVPEEDAVLCDVAVDGGVLQVRAPYPAPEVGERVRLAHDAGVAF